MKLSQQKLHLTTGTILIILMLVLAACANAQAETPPTLPAAPQTKLVISGSGGTSSLIKYLAEAYRQKHNDLTFEFISGSGTSGGVKGTLDGDLDLGAMARGPKDEELKAGIQYLHFATERIAFATSQDVTVSNLTSEQLKDIFLGKITDWSEVGGPAGAINLLVRDEDESNTQILREALFGDTPFPVSAAVFTSEGDLRKALVSANKAIAYVSYGGLRLEKVPANIVVFDGLDAADLSNEYPYSKPAGVSYLPANAPKMQSFLDYVVSKEAQALLTEQGITPAQ